MSSPVIQVDSLWKKYRLGVLGTGTLTHDLNRWWHRVRGKPDPYAKIGEEQKTENRKQKTETAKARDEFQLSTFPMSALDSDEIWALRDISFEVKQGEILGIIGKNGAGKSTLLKILSRVTAPTHGEVRVKGRIASLLEVGTGFHPELTGRENIFLNGAILGMTKAEIKSKLDEIIAFAEVERYIDTPVKRYSSGMYVRLAFAVAAHLDPEILIVDEVLAVGDAAFQKKCLGKMGEISRGGRTVLFVSHNMQAVNVLCKEVLLLKNGEVVNRGPSWQVIECHLSFGTHTSAEATWTFETAPIGGPVKLRLVRVCGSDGKVSYDQRCGAPVTLSMEFWCLRETKLTPSFHLYTQNGILVFPTGTLHVKELAQKVYETGLYRCSCVIPAALLNSGTYLVHAFLSRDTDGLAYVHVPEVVSFQIINDGTAQGGIYTAADYPGILRPLLPWTCDQVSDLPLNTPTILT